MQALGAAIADDGGAAARTARAALLRAMFDAAVASAQPALVVPAHLPPPPRGRTVVVGAGKAAAAMARAVEDHWPAELSGVVVTRHGHAVPCGAIEVIEAGHPVPDAAGVAAAQRLLDAVAGLGADDLVIALVSGGGSALLPALPPGVTLDDERALASALLASGATIREMNTVRKHVSLIKGGRLAQAATPARVVTLVISDVPGDDVSVIASGPTVPDDTTSGDALAILARHAIAVPDGIRAWLADPRSETPDAADLGPGDIRLIATPQRMLEAAADVARAAGYTPLILGDAIEGEARGVGAEHADVVRGIVARGERSVLLSGGETTVTVRGDGRGGRNAEFLLGLLLGLDGAPGVSALAADTDGIDGTEDNAGALIDDQSLAVARAQGLDAAAFLARNDAYGFFDALGALLVTGPTFTNVNDFRGIVIDPPAGLQEQPR